MSNAKYVLENSAEFDRLEKQSQNKFYNYESELSQFKPKTGGTILDAGCGSGIVSRYLAKTHPTSSVVGCDFSEIRVAQAAEIAKGIKNLHFRKENLTQLDFDHSSFDAIACRFVLEHLNETDLPKVISEFYRCLRPNGIICAIDIDGLLSNVFPKTKLMDKVFSKIDSVTTINFKIGREIPHLLYQSGFSNVSWRIEPMQFQGEDLRHEIELLKERFEQAMPFLVSVVGNEGDAKAFVHDYFESLRSPNAVLFYNKFIVQGSKRGLSKT